LWKFSVQIVAVFITFLTLYKENELFQGRFTDVNTWEVRLCTMWPDRNLPNGCSRHLRHLSLVRSVLSDCITLSQGGEEYRS